MAASTKKTSSVHSNHETRESKKDHEAHIERVWELAEKIGTTMFVTWDGERQRARPLAANVRKDENAIHFLVDVHGAKDDQIKKFPIVTLAFADNGGSKYVSITGEAAVLNDRAKIKELWSPFAKAWWDSPEDPNIRVITVTPQDAELWDTPGKLITTVSMLAAAVTGGTPKVGDNAKVSL
jgi:general stress protein 26